MPIVDVRDVSPMIRRSAILAALIGLSACTPRTALVGLPSPPPGVSPHGVINRPITNPDTDLGPIASPLPSVSYGAPQTISLPTTPAVTGGSVSLNFADTDIRTVIDQILGNILHLNYTIDPSIHGTATFHTTTPLPRAELIPVLQALLGQNGAALEQTGTLYRVVPAATAATATSLAGNASVAGSSLIPLRYASATALVAVLQPFIGPGGRIAAAPHGNAVIVAGNPADRATMIALVRAFDVDALAGQSYALLPVKSGSAKDFATALRTALAGKAGLDSVVRIVPLVHVNAVLVVARQPQTIADVRRVYSMIERSQAQTVRSWHVYYLKDSQANNLAYVLQQAFTPNDVTAVPNSAAGANEAASGIASTGIDSMGAGMGGGSMGTSAGNGIETATNLGSNAGGIDAGPLGASGGGIGTGPSGAQTASSQPPQSSANPLLGGLGGSGAGTGGNPHQMRIIPDQQNNALLIYATSNQDSMIDAMLRRIDVLPLEVRIDATIAEVTLNNALQYGTQFFFQKSGGINGILNNASASLTTPANVALNSTFPGFVIGGSGVGGAPLAISALQAVTKVQVLSSPELLVLNGHTAQLQVGALVPYLTTSSQSTLSVGAPVINSIQYEPTGVIMRVTPRVNRNGLVMLKIAQNVSSVSNVVSTQGIQSPTFLQRSISSSVVIQDGQTVGLAGLISDSSSHGNQGIPWLKDIPILGALAGTQNNQRVRTELLVLLTPHVVYNQRDARALTEDMEQSLPNAADVPYQLAVPSAGRSDPNLGVRRALRVRP